MHGPWSAGWLLVALCAATGAYCLLRMRSAVEKQRRTAGGEALMGFGMAAMALPAAVLAPPRWAWLGYAVVFGAAALRAALSARRHRRHLNHHLHHLVGTLAMVYMSATMAALPAGHAGHPGATHSGTGLPLLTGALLLYFTGHVLWSGVRLMPGAALAGAGGAPTGLPGGAGPRWRDRPELSRVCRLSMSIGMLAMLLAV